MLRYSPVLAILLCAPAPAQPPALIGYYAGDGKDLYARDLSPLTHVIHCFQHLNGDTLAPMTKAQEKVLRDLVGRKRSQPGLKVLLSFGGWGGCATCSEAFADAGNRRRFSRDIRTLLERTWTDGIDLDWEYPAVHGPPGHAYRDADRHNFTLLVRELRNTLGDDYEISFAAGGTDECLMKGFEWDSIMPLVDRVHIMSYDLVHGFSDTTGHHTPLFSAGEQVLSADRAVRLLERLRVPRSKMVIGSAFYARVFKDVPPSNDGLFQPGTFSNTVPASAADTTFTPAKGWRMMRDGPCEAAYGYDAEHRRFVTMDDAISVAAKARYVKERGLAGIMFWQIVDDEPVHGLLEGMHHALRQP